MSQNQQSTIQKNDNIKIALGSDQDGFHLKSLILKHLQQQGYDVVDYGTYSTNDTAQHHDFSYKVAKSVATQNQNLGILICGTGIEVSIAANKVHGIRAALVYDQLTAKLAKQVSQANVIALGGRTTKQEDAIKILDAFLTAKEQPIHKSQIQKKISEIQKDQKMGKVVVLKHPLIQHKMSIIRDKNTSSKSFRENVSEVGSLITYELTRDLQLVPKQIETPIKKTTCYQLKKPVILVPILRAGLGMVEGIHNLIPTAKIGHVGIYRDEVTLQPHAYYAKFPSEIKSGVVIVVDPMLATGGSASAAIKTLKQRGAEDIRYAGLVGSPQGIRRLQKDHPDVPICLAALDERLNEAGYIVPGLGDCGDRLFGTK